MLSFLPLLLSLLSIVNGNPISIVSSTWKSLVELSPLPSFVLFSTPTCGHCKKFKPIWSSISMHLKNHFIVGTVDCSSAEGNILCSKYKIKGVPSIKMFYREGPGHDLITLEPDVERNVDALVSYAKRYQPSSIYRLMEGATANNSKIISFKDWISSCDGKKMILFIKGSSSIESPTPIRPLAPSMAMNTLGNLYQSSISFSILHRDQSSIFDKVIQQIKNNEKLPIKGDLLLLIKDDYSFEIKAKNEVESLKFQEIKDILASINGSSSSSSSDKHDL